VPYFAEKMNNYGLKIDKFYVRVFYPSKNSDKYHTLGPYNRDKAQDLVDKYLVSGVCAWVEKVE
jgi:hypothetical protein